MPNLTGFDAGLPANVDAEKTILGAILLDPACFDLTLKMVLPIDFSLDSHMRICKAMARLNKAGSTIDIVTLSNELGRTREIETIGGVAYLASLTEGLPRRPAIEEYLRIVKDKSLLRNHMVICAAGVAKAAEQDRPALEVIGETESELNKLAQSFRQEKTLPEMAFTAYDNLLRTARGEVKKFIPSGCDMIDKTDGGYAKRRLTIIAARPKIGKSALIRQGIYANCKAGNFVHYVSPEMTDEEIILLLAAREANIPWRYIEHPETLNPMQLTYLQSATAAVAEWPLRLDCRNPITATEAVALGRAVRRDHNTQLYALDYFQKLYWGEDRDNRWMQQTDAIQALSNLAKSEEMAVVVLSSLTEPKARNLNDPPTENDLRGVGDIKFELSTLYLMHRKTNEKTRRKEYETQLITGLSRFGEDGGKPMIFNPDTLTFEGDWVKAQNPDFE